MGERNYRLTLAYDGTRYRGWQRLAQADTTIQGKLEAVLSGIFDVPVEVQGSGRTDAGVHARAQVVSFHAPERPVAQLLSALRRYLPEDIGALSLEYAPPRFHARLSATEKTYVYRIWNSAEPDVFERRWRVQLPQKFDLQAMRRGAALLLGAHDFRAFCANKQLKKTSVRTLRRCEIVQNGQELRFELTADGFLYHMARIMVGTLLEIGEGKRSPEEIPALLERRIRAEAGQTVPAKGLFLMEVRYE